MIFGNLDPLHHLHNICNLAAPRCPPAALQPLLIGAPRPERPSPPTHPGPNTPCVVSVPGRQMQPPARAIAAESAKTGRCKVQGRCAASGQEIPLSACTERRFTAMRYSSFKLCAASAHDNPGPENCPGLFCSESSYQQPRRAVPFG